jgi:hypothetical protein
MHASLRLCVLYAIDRGQGESEKRGRRIPDHLDARHGRKPAISNVCPRKFAHSTADVTVCKFSRLGLETPARTRAQSSGSSDTRAESGKRCPWPNAPSDGTDALQFFYKLLTRI